MIIKYIYGIIAIVSFFLLAGYYFQIKKRNRWFLLLYSSVCVVNMGYFIMSISNTLYEALIANRLAYFGSVFLPLCILMIILEVCEIKSARWLVYVLGIISIVVFLIAASGGITEWYYKEVSVEFIDGAARLVKEYGPLHGLYYVYLFSYFASMAGVILYATLKKRMFNLKHATLLMWIVLGNIAIWFIEQMIDVDFEFLSVSYIITELFFLGVYGLLQEQEKMNSLVQNAKMSIDEFIASNPSLLCLTVREQEVLKAILENKKRKDIAEELFVSESTIKKHTAHIFAKLDVSNRNELYEKIGYKF